MRESVRWQQAILDAARYIEGGRSLSSTNRGFWSKWDYPSMNDRLDILGRAEALVEASALLASGDESGTLGGLFAGTAYPVEGSRGGPIDSSGLDVFAKFQFQKGARTIVYLSWSGSYSWDTTLEDIYADIADAIDDYEDFYGFTGGSVVGGSIRMS